MSKKTANLADRHGFRAPRTVYVLEFDDEQYPGLVVRTRALPLGRMLQGIDLSMAADEAMPSAERETKYRELFGLFSEYLVDWNITDDSDQPVPATLAGVLSLEHTFVVPVIRVWIDTVMGVPRPLEQPSPAGAPAPEVSIPMETSFESQAS